jgi:hypothetical protein
MADYMTYLDQWHELSTRIRGLMLAGRLHADYLSVRSSDAYGRGRHLLEQSGRTFIALESFTEAFEASLPAPARTALKKFVAGQRDLMTRQVTGTADEIQERAWAALVLLATFESEMSFLLADTQETVRARSERAFMHLQRSIVVDDAFRKKWQAAYHAGEVECERHGAVHLLLHGIWAFKVNAAGERTDLVYQEPGVIAGAQRYADGLVLTEWKKAGSKTEAPRRFEEARRQAKRYAQGSLGGIELTSVRFAVVVSQQQVTVPDDVSEAGIIYRHISISVDPGVPSSP